MAIVGVVGMSGSGKSTLIREYEQRGYRPLDDIGGHGNWNDHPQTVKALADSGKNVVVSDILFCCTTAADAARVFGMLGIQVPGFHGRADFEQRVGHKIEWVFFENDPWKCAKNCLWRRMHEKRDRKLDFETALILALSSVYKPPDGARPVFDRA